MTSPTIYLHIGQTKTATTTIQAFCHHNRDWLRSQGVLYPESPAGQRPRAKHQHLLECLQAPGVLELGVWEDVVEQALAEHAGKVLVSDEVLWHLHAARPDRRRAALLSLAGCLKGVDVRVLCWLRRQDRWVESWFSQLAKGGGTDMARLDFEQFLASQRAMGMFDYRTLLADWADAFGAERLVVQPFEQSGGQRKDVIAEFAAQLGIVDLSGSSRPSDHQLAFSRPACLLMNQFNREVGDSPLRRKIRLALRPQEGDETDSRRLMSPACARALVESSAEGNAEVARLYRDGRPLFEDLSIHGDSEVYSVLTEEDRQVLIQRLEDAGVDCRWAAKLSKASSRTPSAANCDIRTEAPPLPLRVYLYCLEGVDSAILERLLDGLGVKPSGWHLGRERGRGDKSPPDRRSKGEDLLEPRSAGPVNRLRRLSPGTFCTGQFNPLLIPALVLRERDVHIVVATSRKTEDLAASEMTAEQDGGGTSQAEARHEAALELALFEQVASNPIYQQLAGANRAHFFSMDLLREGRPESQAEALRFARSLGIRMEDQLVLEIYQEALNHTSSEDTLNTPHATK